MDMNLPHALATLTRDVLQNYRPEWWAESTLGRYRVEGEPLIGLDYPDWRMAKSVFRGYDKEFEPPVILVSPQEYQRIERACHEEYQRRVGAYLKKLDGMMRLYCDDPTERLRGPYGPEPVRCVGEDGSIVYAPLHFEHPPLLVKGRLKD